MLAETQPRRLESAPGVANSAVGSFVSSVPELMEWGLRGSALPRRRALTLRLGSVLVFLGLWCLVSGLVVLLELFNPIFLPGPWMVIGAVIELGAKGQLWVHIASTLERVAVGFGTGAVLALGLGLPAGYFRAVRNLVEPVVELLRPIPPLAVLPLFIVWVGIGEGSKIGFITYATFFPMFLTTVHAVRQIDPPGSGRPAAAGDRSAGRRGPWSGTSERRSGSSPTRPSFRCS